MAGPGEGLSIVKQLQAQLKELSQATNKRNDYMEEMKKRTVSDSVLVRARVANIEKSLKGGPAPVPLPMSNAINVNKSKSKPGLTVEIPSPTNGNDPKKLKRDMSTPRETLNTPEDDPLKPRTKSASSARTPQFPAMKSSYLESPVIERQEHVLRPSLAKSIASSQQVGGPTYKEITEKHLKANNKLTLNLVGSSIIRPKGPVTTN